MPKSNIFTLEIKDFIKQNAVGLYTDELTTLVNKTFNTNYTELQIRNFKLYNKITSGMKSGKLLKHKLKRPLGAERVRHKGNRPSIEVKIAEPNTWICKGKLVWEQHNGKIPKGYKITYLDGNPLNTDINNLAVVDNKIMGGLLKYGNNTGNKELRKAQILTVKIRNAIKEKGY